MPVAKQDFLSLLRVADVEATEAALRDRQSAILNMRIVALGYGVPCSRCGGSGNYSFNMIDGTRCFKCRGAGELAPKLTVKLLKSLQGDVESGKLDEYLAKARAKAQADKIVNSAMQAVMKAWTDSGVSQAYKWQLAAQGQQPHRQIADEVNKPMKEAFDRIKNAVDSVNSIRFKIKRAGSKEERLDLEKQLQDAAIEIAKVRDESLQAIEVAKKHMMVILNSLS